MSTFPPSSFDQPRSLNTGLAVTALVCGIVGLCVPLAGVVGIILGIVAISKASSSPDTHGGKGMAIAGIAVGAASLVSMILLIGIMLPALGKARQSARQLKSSAQLHQIDTAMLSYASANQGWFPPAGADWHSLLNTYAVDDDMLTSPRSEQATANDSYIYIPGYRVGTQSPQAIILYENPAYVPRGKVSIAYADGRVEAVDVQMLQQKLDAAPKPPPAAPAGNGSGSSPGSRRRP